MNNTTEREKKIAEIADSFNEKIEKIADEIRKEMLKVIDNPSISEWAYLEMMIDSQLNFSFALTALKEQMRKMAKKGGEQRETTKTI